MAKEKEKRIAKILYVEQGKTAKEIADLVAVSETTLSKWVNDGNWKTERAARINQPALRESNIRQIINDEAERRLNLNRELEQAIADADTEKAADLRKQIASLDDGISKWNKVHDNVAKDKTPLATYLQVMESIFESLRAYNAKLYVETIAFQEMHLTQVSNNYR